MRYRQVCLEAIGYTLPKEVVTSDQIETRLSPLYDRLGLPAGRLELMTGIRQRHFWPPGTLPSGPSLASAEDVLRRSRIDRGQIGALIHGSVCRDHLEPATACRVHHELGLGPSCLVFDVSNACLGVLCGMVQVANMIELGEIRAGLVVATEDCRPLVETTIAALNADTGLSRENVKPAIASLTIGSASVAVLLTHREASRTGHRLTAVVSRAATQHHELCTSGRDEPATSMRPQMATDSEGLLHAGVSAAVDTFPAFLNESGWSRGDIKRTFCHQVGVAHQRMLFQALALDPAIDFTTVEFLGNTGSAALPVTAAIGIDKGLVHPGDKVALLGIGSGINVVMLAVQWAGE